MQDLHATNLSEPALSQTLAWAAKPENDHVGKSGEPTCQIQGIAHTRSRSGTCGSLTLGLRLSDVHISLPVLQTAPLSQEPQADSASSSAMLDSQAYLLSEAANIDTLSNSKPAANVAPSPLVAINGLKGASHGQHRGPRGNSQAPLNEKSRLGKELQRLGVVRLQPCRPRTRTRHRLADMEGGSHEVKAAHVWPWNIRPDPARAPAALCLAAALCAKRKLVQDLEAQRQALQEREVLLRACVACRDAQVRTAHVTALIRRREMTWHDMTCCCMHLPLTPAAECHACTVQVWLGSHLS